MNVFVMFSSARIPFPCEEGNSSTRHDAASLSRPDARRPLAMSIFVALYLSGAAFASAVETAGVARSALSVFPLRKASTARSRYGLPAMPPNTTRASSMVLSLNCKPRAADAMAKSQTPRGLSFSNEARKPGFGGGMTISVRISLKRTTCDYASIDHHVAGHQLLDRHFFD